MTADWLRVDPCPACLAGVVYVWECPAGNGVHFACSFGCAEHLIEDAFMADPVERPREGGS